MPAASSADLDEARAVDAEARPAAPQIGRADEALGDIDEVARDLAIGRDVAAHDEPPPRSSAQALVASATSP